MQPLHPRCFLAPFSEKPCDGPMDRSHLLPKQRLKRLVSDDPRLVWHPSLWVWACRRHHGDLDNRRIRLGRDQLPRVTVEAAEILGLSWMLDRDYGPVAELNQEGRAGRYVQCDEETLRSLDVDLDPAIKAITNAALGETRNTTGDPQ